MAGPWERYGAVAGAPAMPAPAYVVPPNPARLAEKQAERDRQAAADARAQAAAERAANAERRAQIAFDERNAPGGKTSKPTEYQSKSAGFLGRMMRANEAYQQVDAGSRDPRTTPGQWLHETFPNLDNSLNTDARQSSDQNARDFIAATLRQESGAAISAEEFRNQYRIYFPMPGDGPDVLKQKALARKQAIEGFRVAAGPLADQVPNVGTGLEAGTRDPQAPRPVEQGGVGMFGPTPDGPKNPLSPEQQRAYDAFTAANPQASEQQLATFFQGMGFDIDPANARAVAEAARKGAGYAPGSEAQSGLTPAEKAEVERRMQETSSLEAGLAGATDTAALGFADEAASGLEAMFGEGSGSFGDRFDSALRTNRAYQDAMSERGPAYMVGQVGGGLLAPAGVGTSISRLAMAGGVQGGLYGVGSGEGAGDRLGRGLTGATVGAGAGAAFGAAAPRIRDFLTRSREASQATQLMQAAQRLDVQPMRADVGGPATRLATAGAAQSMLSTGSVTKAAQRAQQGMADARGRIAGEVLPLDEAGQVVRRGAERFTKETSARGGRLYDRAHEAASGVKVKPLEALSVIDGHLAELGQAGEMAGPIIADLEKMRRSLAQGGGLTPQGVRTVRTALADAVRRDNLRGTDTERRMKMVVEALSSDMERGLVEAGRKDAATMFRRADTFWRERVEHIDQVLEPILGRGKSGEDIIRHIEAMGGGNRGGSARLSRLMSGLSDEEAAGVRGTLIDRLGRGSRDAGDNDNFSANRLVTQWDGLSRKGKQALFGNSETRRALDDLAFVAREMKASARYANHSNTAGGVLNVSTLGGGGALVATGQIVPVAVAALVTHLTGRFLGAPAGAKWVSGMARARTPQAVERQIGRLSVLAQRQPAIAQDALGLQRVLTEALSQSPGRAAAQQEGDARQEPPYQQ